MTPSTSTRSFPSDFERYEPLEKLTFIATGDKMYPLVEGGGPPRNPPKITAEQYTQHKIVINDIVSSMRQEYTNPNLHGEEVRRYYDTCWKEFDTAKTDSEIAKAVSSLMTSIRWE